MSEIDDGGHFFPIKDDGWNPGTNGITRRDWLAGLAMQGLMSMERMPTMKGGDPIKGEGDIAIVAYTFADAMIAEGKK